MGFGSDVVVGLVRVIDLVLIVVMRFFGVSWIVDFCDGFCCFCVFVGFCWVMVFEV